MVLNLMKKYLVPYTLNLPVSVRYERLFFQHVNLKTLSQIIILFN